MQTTNAEGTTHCSSTALENHTNATPEQESEAIIPTCSQNWITDDLKILPGLPQMVRDFGTNSKKNWFLEHDNETVLTVLEHLHSHQISTQ